MCGVSKPWILFFVDVVQRKIFAHLYQDTWELALFLDAQSKLNFDPFTPISSPALSTANDPDNGEVGLEAEGGEGGGEGDSGGGGPIDPADDPAIPTYLKPFKRSPYHKNCFEPTGMTIKLSQGLWLVRFFLLPSFGIFLTL